MAPAAVEVHHPNRRFMVRRRSGHAIAPAVVYDARLATPGPEAPVPMAGEGDATGYPRASRSSWWVLARRPPWSWWCQHRGWMLLRSRKDGDAVSRLAANPGRSPTVP